MPGVTYIYGVHILGKLYCSAFDLLVHFVFVTVSLSTWMHLCSVTSAVC